MITYHAYGYPIYVTEVPRISLVGDKTRVDTRAGKLPALGFTFTAGNKVVLSFARVAARRGVPSSSPGGIARR